MRAAKPFAPGSPLVFIGPLSTSSLVELLHSGAISPLGPTLNKEVQELDPDCALLPTPLGLKAKTEPAQSALQWGQVNEYPIGFGSLDPQFLMSIQMQLTGFRDY